MRGVDDQRRQSRQRRQPDNAEQKQRNYDDRAGLHPADRHHYIRQGQTEAEVDGRTRTGGVGKPAKDPREHIHSQRIGGDGDPDQRDRRTAALQVDRGHRRRRHQ